LQTLALDQGEQLVRCMSVADLLDSGVAPPTVIKLDAEGGEGEILESAAHLLPENSRLVV